MKNMSHQAIRKDIYTRRCQLSIEAQRSAAKKAAQYLIHSDLFNQSRHIACYLVKGAEMSAQPIIDAIWLSGKCCYVPIVHPTKLGEMFFIEYKKGDQLINNRFDIQEPIFDETRLMSPRDLDLVIMPLTAFDKFGHRIGMGGGYYDHEFSFLKEEPNFKKPILCGLAYVFQEVEYIETQLWDISMNAWVTEKGIHLSEQQNL